MPRIPVFVARIDIGTCSGNIFSYEPIDNLAGEVDGTPCRIIPISEITIETPEGYNLETVSNANPYGDEGERLVFDPQETARAASGRVYMRAARLVERMRFENLFVQVGSGRSLE